jgi:serine/threonine protein kinase
VDFSESFYFFFKKKMTTEERKETKTTLILNSKSMSQVSYSLTTKRVKKEVKDKSNLLTEAILHRALAQKETDHVPAFLGFSLSLSAFEMNYFPLSVSQWIRETRQSLSKNQTIFPFTRCLQLLLFQLLPFLHRLHTKYHVLHRDLLPNNLHWNPQTQKVILIDFGLSLHLPTTLSYGQVDSSSLDGRYPTGWNDFEQIQKRGQEMDLWQLAWTLLFFLSEERLPHSTKLCLTDQHCPQQYQKLLDHYIQHTTKMIADDETSSFPSRLSTWLAAVLSPSSSSSSSSSSCNVSTAASAWSFLFPDEKSLLSGSDDNVNQQQKHKNFHSVFSDLLSLQPKQKQTKVFQTQMMVYLLQDYEECLTDANDLFDLPL